MNERKKRKIGIVEPSVLQEDTSGGDNATTTQSESEKETNWGEEYDKTFTPEAGSTSNSPSSNPNTGAGDITTPPSTQNGTEAVNPWQTQLDSVMQQIMGQGQFNYDMNGDALYQQYTDIYENQARLSMENAMAQASALTGGYGSSYSQAVGQQAYAQQLQNLNEVGMDLYDRAYARDQAERQQLLQQYSMLSSEAQRWVDNKMAEEGLAWEKEKHEDSQLHEMELQEKAQQREDDQFDFFYGTERDENGNIIKSGEGYYDKMAAEERKTKAETANDSSGETVATKAAVTRIDGLLSSKNISATSPKGKNFIEEEIASLLRGERISEAEMNYLIYYYGLDE